MSSQAGISGINMATKAEPRGAGVFVLSKVLAAGTGAQDVVVSAEFSFRVIDVHMVNSAQQNNASTVQLRKGTTAISDAMSAQKSAHVVTRAASVNQSVGAVAKGESINLNVATNTAPVEVFITCVRE